MTDETRLIARELRRVASAWAFAQVVSALSLLVGFVVLAWGVVELMRGMAQIVR